MHLPGKLRFPRVPVSVLIDQSYACDRKAPRDMIANRQTFNYCALCRPEYFKQEQLKAWGILE